VFDSAFEYEFVQNEKPADGDLFQLCKLYRCKGEKSNQVYLIRSEQYDFNLYSIKFHLKNHSQSEDKFKLRTNLFEVQPLIRTCLNLLLDVFRNEPYASFIIIGESDKEETRLNTIRFRVYRRVLESFFSPVEFEHRVWEGLSAYVMLNRNYPQKQELLNYIDDKLQDVLDF
jgi:hypothetical protein